MSHGGCKRTIFCPCGKVFTANVREANMKFKMHQKVCNDAPKIDMSKQEFDMDSAYHNGINGVSLSRNKNLVHTKEYRSSYKEKDDDNVKVVLINKKDMANPMINKS